MINMMKKNNKILTEILKKGFFVGLDFQNDYLFIEYMTSLYIINPKNLLMEFFLYNFLSGDSNKYIQKIFIKSNFSFENIILFIENNFQEKKKKIEIIKNNNDYIKDNIIQKCQFLIKDFFEIEDNNSIKKIKYVIFFFK